MANYKDIYYANSSDNLSKYDIEYASAVSIGDKLEEIKLGSAVIVANTAARDALFPSPKQGDGVWNNNLKIEQRYYEALSSANPGGRTPAGWYRVTAANNIIVPGSISTGGVGTGTITSNGEIEFSQTSTVKLFSTFTSNILPGGLVSSYPPQYNSYKIVGNISLISPATYVIWSFINNAGNVLSQTYYHANYGFTTVNAGGVGSNVNFSLASTVSAETGVYFELDIMNGFFQPPSYPTVVGFRTRSSIPGSGTSTQILRRGGHVNNATGATGLQFTTPGSTAKITGSIRIYGVS